MAEPKIGLRDLEIVVEQGHIEESGSLEVGYIGIVPPIYPYTILYHHSSEVAVGRYNLLSRYTEDS